MIDDELHHLWASFKPGVRVVMFSDSYHSGTVARNVERASANDKTSTQLRTFRQNQLFYEAIAYEAIARGNAGERPIGCSVILISGCQNDQLSMDGAYNGAFTGELKKVLGLWLVQRQLPTIHRRHPRQLPKSQYPNYFTTGTANPLFEAQQTLAI